MRRLDRVAIIARWKPVHIGQAPVLRGLCDCAEQAIIGIGSSNRYDLRNPFTVAETADMIRLVLEPRTNYTLLEVPDLDDGPRWRRMVLGMVGSADRFFTDNPYVASLLGDDYDVAVGHVAQAAGDCTAGVRQIDARLVNVDRLEAYARWKRVDQLHVQRRRWSVVGHGDRVGQQVAG